MKKKLNILLLGGGGREHALAWKISQSPLLDRLFAAPGSSAIANHAECASLDIVDPKAVVAHATSCKADLIVIGPEAPLQAGVADALRDAGFLVFGPGKETAQLETSKAFAKRFMTKHNIPTASYEIFSDAQGARSAAEAMKTPFVIKADGLAAGKGVRICKHTNHALGTITEFMEQKVFGTAGETVILERLLEGPELSLLALCDSKNFHLLPTSRDHKRIFDGDQGPNTGGMGAFSPAKVDEETMVRIQKEVLGPILRGLAADKLDFKGVLYVGLMLTKDGPKVLEFNCRFGDPEAQAVLPLIKSDLLDLMMDCAQGSLGHKTVEINPGASVCVTLASEGYPEKPKTGREITGLSTKEDGKTGVVFHSGTKEEGGRWLTTGGRVLGVTAFGKDVDTARTKAYEAVSNIRFEGMQYRKDIAVSASKAVTPV